MGRHEQLERIVSGALRDMLTQHGVMTTENMHSAVKRVVKQLEGANASDPDLAGALALLHSRVHKMKHGNRRLQQQIESLHARDKELRKIVRALAEGLAPIYDMECLLCDAFIGTDDSKQYHTEDCPYRMACEWAATHSHIKACNKEESQ